jgi:dTDP-4-dehydrorhamnose reductase
MRILVVAGLGMLGHKLVQVLGGDNDVIATVREGAASWPKALPAAEVVPGVDIRDTPAMAAILDHYAPQAVLNAAGVIKHVVGAYDLVDTVAINGTAPNILAHLCESRGIRLVQYSTDCVFTGAQIGMRGPNGYREEDVPDARDLYGMTKYLGEPGRHALVLRTSIIGRELKGHHGLVDWFLSQGEGPVKGYKRALFTGLPTTELARVTGTVLRDHPDLNGLWQVATEPIDKYSLLGLLKNSFDRPTIIQPDEAFYCDRRLDGSRFAARTGWKFAPWPELAADIAQDSFDYSPYSGKAV